MNEQQLDLLIQYALDNKIGAFFINLELDMNLMDYFNNFSDIFAIKTQPEYITKFKSALLNKRKEDIKIENNRYLYVFLTLFNNLDSPNLEIKNNLKLLFKPVKSNKIDNSFFAKLDNIIYTTWEGFKPINNLLNIFYNTFKDDKKIINQLNNYTNIANKLKVSIFKNIISKTEKELKNHKYEKHYKFYNKIFDIFNLFELINKLKYFSFTEEEEKQIDLKPFMLYLNDKGKTIFLNKVVINMQDNLKEYFIKNYLSNEALKKLVNNNDDEDDE